MCGEFWLVRQRVFWFSDLLPHAKTRDRETTEFKMVLEMFGTGWTSCNEVIRHDAVRTTIPHSHHRVGIISAHYCKVYFVACFFIQWLQLAQFFIWQTCILPGNMVNEHLMNKSAGQWRSLLFTPIQKHNNVLKIRIERREMKNNITDTRSRPKLRDFVK